MHRGPGHQWGQMASQATQVFLIVRFDFYNVPKLSIRQSVEVKVALHYIRKQLACHKGLFLSSHTAHNAILIQQECQKRRG